MADISGREIDWVLTGLRLLQSAIEDDDLGDDLADIATRGGQHPLPDTDQINALCERINT